MDDVGKPLFCIEMYTLPNYLMVGFWQLSDQLVLQQRKYSVLSYDNI